MCGEASARAVLRSSALPLLRAFVTYLQFHATFIAPVLVALWLLRPRPSPPWWPLLALVGIAFAYTTPWDNFLVANAVWTYPPDRVWFTVGYVPIEEYAFFGLQTVMTGLWYRILRPRVLPEAPPYGPASQKWPGVAVFGALSVAGWACIAAGGHGLYLGLILGWACPVLAGMWWIAGAQIWAHRRLIAWAVVPMTLYLWLADRIAIGLEIWDITDATRTGWEIVGLPVEEALFFVVTNLLVAQGLAMFAPSRQRAGA